MFSRAVQSDDDLRRRMVAANNWAEPENRVLAMLSGQATQGV